MSINDRVTFEPTDKGWLVSMEHRWTEDEFMSFTVLIPRTQGQESVADLQKRAFRELRNRLPGPNS